VAVDAAYGAGELQSGPACVLCRFLTVSLLDRYLSFWATLHLSWFIVGRGGVWMVHIACWGALPGAGVVQGLYSHTAV
jgi:hypothetical protein